MTRDLRRATAALIATTLLLVGGVASASADDIDDRRAAAERRQSEILGNREQLQSELEDTDAALAQAVVARQANEPRLHVAPEQLAEAEADVERPPR